MSEASRKFGVEEPADPLVQPKLFRDPGPLKGTDRTESLMQLAMASYRAELVDALGVCESPIEVDMALALISANDGNGPFLRLTEHAARGGRAPWAKGRAGTLYLQHPHKVDGESVRIDMVLVTEVDRLAVECDGNYGHHRTPAQAQKDKARDRALTADGWTPIRFTGCDIKRDACKCAAYLLGLAKCKPGIPPPLAVVKTATKPEAPPADAATIRRHYENYLALTTGVAPGDAPVVPRPVPIRRPR
jgi:hypothetical protein